MKEVLSYELKDMDLESSLEYYPELIKKFRLLKKHAKQNANLQKMKDKFKGKNVSVSVEKLDDLLNDNYEFLIEVVENMENLPILYVMDKVDYKTRKMLIEYNCKFFDKLIKLVDIGFSTRVYPSYGNKAHKSVIMFIYTLREYIRLELRNALRNSL